MLKKALPSPAMVVALIALVLAAGGTAIAATHLVSGNSLIKKHSLSGNRLRSHTITGQQIKLSALGTVPTAAHAKQADTLTTLPSGKSESGIFSAGGGDSTAGYIGYGLTYSRPLASPIPNSNIIDNHGPLTNPHCPGFGQAARGYLCLYNTIFEGVGSGYGFSNDPSGLQQSPSLGVVLYWQINGGGQPYVGGEWTVTAP